MHLGPCIRVYLYLYPCTIDPLCTWFKWKCISLKFGGSCSAKRSLQSIFVAWIRGGATILFNKLQNVLRSAGLSCIGFSVLRFLPKLWLDSCMNHRTKWRGCWNRHHICNRAWPTFCIFVNLLIEKLIRSEHTDYPMRKHRRLADARHRIWFAFARFADMNISKEHAQRTFCFDSTKVARSHGFVSFEPRLCLIIVSNPIFCAE